MKPCLVVDDSPTVRKIMGRIMHSLGFEVREAGDGREALEACERSMPELVMLDWNMPVMDGLTFLQHLRRTPGGDRPVVILCTTVCELPNIEKALENGANEYIMKPFDAELVRLKLEQTGLLQEDG